MLDSRESMIAQEISGKLWNIYDKGRASLSASVYAYHMLVLLWIKYRTDKRRDEGGWEKENIDDFKEIAFREIDFKEIYRERESKYIGHRINEYMHMLFEEVDFGNIYIFGKEGTLLKEMIEGIGELDLRPSRLKDDKILSRICKKLTERIIKEEERGSGIEWMPEQVAQLMTQLMAIQEDERVYDPCCGAGGLLLEASKLVNSSKGYLYGETSQGMMRDLAKINFMFEHQTNYTILQKNSLMTLVEEHPPIYNKFDVCLSDIRFVKYNWTDELRHSERVYKRLIGGVLSRMSVEYTYISHMLYALKEEGRMAVIVNHGVLFRGGMEQKIREELIKQNLLDAVIGLPSHLFNRSSMAVCLLILKKNRVHQDVLFIDASSEAYYMKDKLVNTLTESGLETIIKTYKSRETITNFSYGASYEELSKKEFNLNIESYIQYKQEKEEIALDELKQSITHCEERSEEIRKRFEECVEKLLK